jgi:hypothetical protein
MTESATIVVCSPATPDNSDIFTGWKTSGTDRGSIDIIWSCIVIIGLCCWVSTYPNVPSVTDQPLHRLIDKLNLACTGLLGPDFLPIIAGGQFANARRSVEVRSICVSGCITTR